MEQRGTSTEVGVSRPEIPESYGIPRGKEGMLPWSHVGERMAVERNYWLATVRPDGRPHSVPVWGVWVEESLYFGGGRSTRKARNLATNPNVVAHSESGENVVILEGVVEEVTDPALQERIRSEEHTSELQSRQYLVCRLLLEKKKTNDQYTSNTPT